MRFFKAKKKSEAVAPVAQAAETNDETVETEKSNGKEINGVETLKSDLDMAVVPTMKAKEEASAEALKPAENKAEQEPAAAADTAVTAIRLFPGFESKPFEIGYAGYKSADYGIEEETPMLLMRWKAGKGTWFPLPPMFNKAVLEEIHEVDSDLDRLLIGYGYDADQLARK